jgi:hypothetical protein
MIDDEDGSRLGVAQVLKSGSQPVTTLFCCV